MAAATAQTATAPAVTANNDAGSTNTGSTPIEMIWVALKPVASSSAAAAGVGANAGANTADADVGSRPGPKYRCLNYPNIPGEDLLDNDWVIVQCFTVNPGQWAGMSARIPSTSSG
jgi:hypothetical protein